MILAPAFAKPLAMAKPMPYEAPVTQATLPSRRKSDISIIETFVALFYSKYPLLKKEAGSYLCCHHKTKNDYWRSEGFAVGRSPRAIPAAVSRVSCSEKYRSKGRK